MFVSPKTSLTPLTLRHEIPQTNLVRWDDFTFRTRELAASMRSGRVALKVLNGTNLACVTDTVPGQWDKRQAFIEAVLADIVEHCPKDEPLVIVSQGSDRALTEYIVGKTLIDLGFKYPYFFLIDPAYKFSDSATMDAMKKVIHDFCTLISSAFADKQGTSLPESHVKFLSRGQNVSKYFPAGANVVVIECLPPYAEPLKDIAATASPSKACKDLIAQGYVVNEDNANTVALMPFSHKKLLVTAGANLTTSIPLAIFKKPGTSNNIYFDGGCKIKQDGTYSLSFSGWELLMPPESMFLPKLQQQITQVLGEQIPKMLKDSAEKKLSQQNMTELLKKVAQIVNTCLPQTTCIYLADYSIDHEEMMEHISKNAGHHYRRSFSLMADPIRGSSINKSDIL